MHEKILSLKSYTSRLLKVVAISYMCFPVVYLVLTGILLDIPGDKFAPILWSPLFYFMSFWAMVAGYGIWQMVQWGWYVFVAVNFVIVYHTAWVVVNFAGSHQRYLAFFVGMALLFLLVVRVSWEMRVPYFLPRIRWWEPEPATRLSAATVIHRTDGDPYRGSILDLSLGGCFVKCPETFAQDQLLLIDFQLFDQRIECRGHVVWRARSTVTHPKGIGVKFAAVDKTNRRKLRMVLSRLKKREEQKLKALAS